MKEGRARIKIIKILCVDLCEKNFPKSAKMGKNKKKCFKPKTP